MKIIGRGTDGSPANQSYILEVSDQEMDFLKDIMGRNLERAISGKVVSEVGYLRDTVKSLARNLGIKIESGNAETTDNDDAR